MSFKNIAIIYNPISGSGKAESMALGLKELLLAVGAHVSLRESLPTGRETELESYVNEADLLFICGGDGTVRSMLEVLMRTKTPVYMLPAGNESLFAKEFSMSSNPEFLLEVLRTGEVQEHYVPRINDIPFFLMASVGFDSETVKAVSEDRSAPIGNSGYLKAMLRLYRRHCPPRVTVICDGQTVVDRKRGFFIIANAKQYAMGLCFLPEADSCMSQLHARFFPYERLVASLPWLLRCWIRPESLQCPFPLVCGSSFSISIDTPPGFPIQADGEYLADSSAEVLAGDTPIRVLCRS